MDITCPYSVRHPSATGRESRDGKREPTTVLVQETPLLSQTLTERNNVEVGKQGHTSLNLKKDPDQSSTTSGGTQFSRVGGDGNGGRGGGTSMGQRWEN